MPVKETTAPQVLLNNIGTLPELLSNIAANMLLEIEIGCGNGHFLSMYAEEKDMSYLIGVELKQKRCLKALKKIQTYRLSNAAIIQDIDSMEVSMCGPWASYISNLFKYKASARQSE